jgi:hypothetical protein
MTDLTRRKMMNELDLLLLLLLYHLFHSHYTESSHPHQKKILHPEETSGHQGKCECQAGD